MQFKTLMDPMRTLVFDSNWLQKSTLNGASNCLGCNSDVPALRKKLNKSLFRCFNGNNLMRRPKNGVSDSNE